MALTNATNHPIYNYTVLDELDWLLPTGITPRTNYLFGLVLQNPEYSMPYAGVKDNSDASDANTDANVEFDDLWRDRSARRRRTGKKRKTSIMDAKGKPGTLKTQKNHHPEKTYDKRTRNARLAAVHDREFRTTMKFYGHGDEDHYYPYRDYLDRLDRHLTSLDDEDFHDEDFHDEDFHDECHGYHDCFFCPHYMSPECPFEERYEEDDFEDYPDDFDDEE